MHGEMTKGARFSECRVWRYALWRTWDPARAPLVFVGLNPSTADETQDDPTIRRCLGFARDFGCGGLHMLNIFAFRATNPDELRRTDDPVGPDNEREFHCTCGLAPEATSNLRLGISRRVHGSGQNWHAMASGRGP